MKKLLQFCLLFSFLGALQAQNSYLIDSIAYNPDPFASGTNLNINQDDVWGSVAPLPFSFCFYDQSYDSIQVGSNGIVSFEFYARGSYCPWAIQSPMPSSMTFLPRAICTPWQDLNPSFGGIITMDVKGVAPYRRVVISFDNMAMFSCTGLFFSQQVILYETTNVIEVHIQDKPTCSTWNSGAAIEGICIDSTTAFVVPDRNYPTQWTVANDGYRFTPVGACAGIPPGDSVLGRVYTDYNNNCTFDSNEFPIANRSILANGGAYYAWSNNDGNYGLGMAPGAYTIAEAYTSPFLVSSCVPGGAHNVTLSGNVLSGMDFPDSVATVCSDLSVSIGSSGLPKCLNALISVLYCNQGTYPDSNVVVTVVLNDSISLDSANLGYTTTGLNTYAFNVGNLLPGQCGLLNLNCGIGCDSAGTIYCVSASIVGTYANECNLFNNTNQDCQALVAPYDPNIKLVAAQDFGSRGYVEADDIDNTDELVYMVHFQNVGTTTAQNVVIRDTLDAALLPESLQAGAASALYNYVVNGNEVIFRFNNIQLPDSNTNEPGSHGFVKFSVQQRPGNVAGTVIENHAAIYFDFEAPVVTNSTINTIPLIIGLGAGFQDVAQVFPNPGKDQLIVKRFVEADMVFQLFDLRGKLLKSSALTEMQTTIGTQDLAAGLYLYRIESAGRLLESGKWVRE